MLHRFRVLRASQRAVFHRHVNFLFIYFCRAIDETTKHLPAGFSSPSVSTIPSIVICFFYRKIPHPLFSRTARQRMAASTSKKKGAREQQLGDAASINAVQLEFEAANGQPG